MRPFTWLAPDTIADAVALLRSHGPGARVIAGGQSLLLAMKDRSARPSHLVSVAGIADLAGVTQEPGGSLAIGATTTYAALARASLSGWHARLADVAGNLADRPVRNRGTVGGALCTADPRYDLPAFAVGVGATLRISGAGGDRELSAEQFLKGPLATALGADEILTALVLPPVDTWDTVVFEKFRQRVFDAAIVSATCALRRGAQAAPEARVTIGGATGVPAVVATAARLLAGAPSTGGRAALTESADAADVGEAAAEEVLPDATSAGEPPRYRRELVRTLVRRTAERAITELGSP